MPIKGLTDRQAQFPQIGVIRKGGPKQQREKNGRKYEIMGKDLDHFRVLFDEAEVTASSEFVHAYGNEPKEINILLPFNSVNENFDAWQEAYKAGGLIHRCDGEKVWYEIDPKTGERLVTNGDPYKLCDGSSDCKPSGRLKVIVPELQRLAFLTVVTTSYHDIANISRQLQALLQINGKLAGVPLKLRRRPVKIATPKSETDRKKVRRVKHLLSIEADPEWVRAKLNEMRTAALPGNGLEQLAAPEVVKEEIVEAEFEEVETDEPVKNTDNGFEEDVARNQGSLFDEEIQEGSDGEAWPGYMIDALIKADLAANPFNAIAILNLFPDLPRNTSKERLIELITIYRARRSKGKDQEILPVKAANVAWEEWKDSK